MNSLRTLPLLATKSRSRFCILQEPTDDTPITTGTIKLCTSYTPTLIDSKFTKSVESLARMQHQHRENIAKRLN